MFGEQNILLLLDVVDFIVDNGNDKILDQVSSKEFLFCLLNLLKTKNFELVQCTLLGLIKKWGENFADNAQYTTFSDMYNHLKRNNVAFPEEYTSVYTKYVPSEYHPRSRQRQAYSSYSKNDSRSNNNANFGNGGSSSAEFEFDYVENIKPSLDAGRYNKRYWKLVNYLMSMTENVSLANEMIDNSTPSNIDDSLREVVHNLHSGNNRIIQTIASERLKDEKLMDITLNISEDIRRTLLRWECLSNQGKVEPFISTFMEKNLMSGMPIKKKKTTSTNYNDGSYSKRDYKQEVQAIKTDPNIKSADDLFDLFGNMEQSSQSNMNTMNMNMNINMNVNQQLFQQQQQPFQQQSYQQQQQQSYQQQPLQQQSYQQQQQQTNPLNLFSASQPVVTNVNTNPQQQFNSMGYPQQHQQQQQGNMPMQNNPPQQSPIEDLKSKLNQLYTTMNSSNTNAQNLFAGYGQGQQQQQSSQSAFGMGLGQISQPLALPEQMQQQQPNQFGANQQQNPPFNMDLGFNNNNNPNNTCNQFGSAVNMNIMDYSQPSMNTMNLPLNQPPQMMDNNPQFGVSQPSSYQQNGNNTGSMYPNFQSTQMGNIDEAKLKEIDGLF